VIGFALFTGLAAQWKIYLPFTPVPITGQTMAVLLSGAALGMRAGAASQLVYIGLGAVGLPLFADASSGFHVLVGPTAGYLAGFVVAAALIGRLAEAKADRRVLSAVPAFAVGSIAVYVFGVIGLMITLGWGLAEAVGKGVIPFLIGDALKAIAAGLILPAAWRLRG
jgi:biotin transport system substrate-specific component